MDHEGHAASYRWAEHALLESEGVVATDEEIELTRIGGRARVLITGEGPAVLLVPGAMTTGVVFAGLVARLSGFRCVMVERPGTGLTAPLSDPPRTLDAKRSFADAWLIDTLDGLDIDRAHVVSTSLGGWHTFRSVAAHPERFNRMVGIGFQVGARISDAPLSMRVGPPPWLIPRRIPATKRIVRALLKGAGMRGAIERGLFDDVKLEWMAALLRHTETFRSESLNSPRPIGLRGPIDAVRHDADLLGRVTLPVHLVWGTDDLFGGQECAREFASHLPDATVDMIEGAGHAPWIDEPDRVAAATQAHLSG